MSFNEMPPHMPHLLIEPHVACYVHDKLNMKSGSVDCWSLLRYTLLLFL